MESRRKEFHLKNFEFPVPSSVKVNEIEYDKAEINSRADAIRFMSNYIGDADDFIVFEGESFSNICSLDGKNISFTEDDRELVDWYDTKINSNNVDL